VARVPVGKVGALAHRRGHGGTGDHLDVVAAGQSQHVVDAARSPTTWVEGRRDRGQFEVRPAEQHGKGAGVVGVAAQVGVEVQEHRASMTTLRRPAQCSSTPR